MLRDVIYFSERLKKLSKNRTEYFLFPLLLFDSQTQTRKRKTLISFFIVSYRQSGLLDSSCSQKWHIPTLFHNFQRNRLFCFYCETPYRTRKYTIYKSFNKLLLVARSFFRYSRTLMLRRSLFIVGLLSKQTMATTSVVQNELHFSLTQAHIVFTMTKSIQNRSKLNL